MTSDMRKNLGMLVLAIPVALVGLSIAQAMEEGVFVVMFAALVAMISVVKIGLELMRPRETKPADLDAPRPL